LIILNIFYITLSFFKTFTMNIQFYKKYKKGVFKSQSKCFNYNYKDLYKDKTLSLLFKLKLKLKTPLFNTLILSLFIS